MKVRMVDFRKEAFMQPVQTIIKITEGDEWLQVAKIEFPGTEYETEYWLQRVTASKPTYTVLFSFRITEDELLHLAGKLF